MEERVVVEIDCPWTGNAAETLFSHLTVGGAAVCYLCRKDHALGVTTMPATVAADSSDESVYRFGFRALWARVSRKQEDLAYDKALAVFKKSESAGKGGE